jgi:hypothetical protein
MLFRIYIIEKKPKRKNQKEKRKKKRHLPPLQKAVGLKKPPCHLAVAACQPAATQTVLPPVETAVGSNVRGYFCQC